MKQIIAEMRKFFVAIIGTLGMILSAGLLNGEAKIIVVSIIGFATTVGVYQVPNATVSTSGSAVSTQQQQQGVK